MQQTAAYQRAETLADLMLKLMWTCQRRQELIAERSELSLSEFKCLRSFRYDTELSVKEIASRMSLTSSRLTRIIDGLVRKRYVTRHIDPVDRRIINVRLTKQGELVGKKVSVECINVYERAFDFLPEESHLGIIECVKNLASAMNKDPGCEAEEC